MRQEGTWTNFGPLVGPCQKRSPAGRPGPWKGGQGVRKLSSGSEAIGEHGPHSVEVEIHANSDFALDLACKVHVVNGRRLSLSLIWPEAGARKLDRIAKPGSTEASAKIDGDGIGALTAARRPREGSGFANDGECRLIELRFAA